MMPQMMQPGMMAGVSPSGMAGEGMPGMGGTTTAEPFKPDVIPTQDFKPNLVPIDDIDEGTLAEYMNIENEPGNALRAAYCDKDWKQVAIEYDILTGDPMIDGRVWRQHQEYVQMKPGTDPDLQDPLMANEDAIEEYRRRVLKRMLGSELFDNLPEVGGQEY